MAHSPINMPVTTQGRIGDPLPMTVTNKPLLMSPPSTMGYRSISAQDQAAVAFPREAYWPDIAITAPSPCIIGAASSSAPSTNNTRGWGAVTTTIWATDADQEKVSASTQHSFLEDNTLPYSLSSSSSISPSLVATASFFPASTYLSPAHLMEQRTIHNSSFLDARNIPMIPRQFIEPESGLEVERDPTVAPGGWATQLSVPWDMDQVYWADPSEKQSSMGVGDWMSGVPVAPTKMNQELLQVFVKHLSRFQTSLDGNPDASNPYIKHYVPWCLSSRLLSHIALYTSACFLLNTGHFDHMVAMSLKSQAIGMLNVHINGKGNDINNSNSKASDDEAVAAIMQLILDEWYWGERRQELKSHLTDMRDMIATRGGIVDLGLGGLLGKLALSTDRSISLFLEAPPFLPSLPFSPGDGLCDISSGSGHSPFRVPHNTPLVPSQVPFEACAEVLGLHPATAGILDDVRFLLSTVLKLPGSASDQERKKVESTAKWIHDRISSLPSSLSTSSPSSMLPDLKEDARNSSRNAYKHPHEKQQEQNQGDESQEEVLHQSIRLTSLLYTRAIVVQQPLSQSCTPEQFLRVWYMARRIPLSTWKRMLGVFLWLVCAVAPAAAVTATQHARFVKSMLHIACTQMTVEGWEIAQQSMERMVILQKWLARGLERTHKS